MVFDEFKSYLEKVSEDSKFKVSIEEAGGYLVFTNSSNKYFTISLLALSEMLQDILNNLAIFSKHSNYVEKEWRDLSKYYSNSTIQSISTVQTKPLFSTLNKIIHWANEENINDEKTIDLSKESIEKTINSLNELILFFTPNISKNEKEKEKFTNKALGNLDFPHKNLLLKGVPGTGKSHTLETIIENDLNLKDNPKNICHINIHSASSNADLMQGIGINSNNGQIEYKEKQGLIYNHIKKALFTPNQPFVLILEEIQENSLNELIGDLIYLIEEKKRVSVDSAKFEDGKAYEYQEFIEKVLEEKDNKHSIQIPYLVDTSTAYRKMVLPSNLYIFCTSNYRDDKKVIEDNLLRRFDVVEIYPQYQDKLGKEIFKSKDVSDFLEELNNSILTSFESEIHPDRYLIGHANWLNIEEDENKTEEEREENKKLFYTALLKFLVEFKEIREVDFETYTKEIIEGVCTNNKLSDRLKRYIQACNFEYSTYKEMIEKLQKEIYSFLK